MRVLWVDDDPDIRMVGELTLSFHRGWSVTSLASGREALALQPDAPFDVILLDVMMPDLDGVKAVEALRELAWAKETPIVFVTARVQSVDLQHYATVGVQGVIKKPFDPAAIAAEIEAIVARSRT